MNYVVKPGDTLSKLAAQYLGDPSYYTKILAVNPDILTPSLIKVGQVVKIPVTSTASKDPFIISYTKYLLRTNPIKLAGILGVGVVTLLIIRNEIIKAREIKN
jgi:LysM repeat protein